MKRLATLLLCGTIILSACGDRPMATERPDVVARVQPGFDKSRLTGKTAKIPIRTYQVVNGKRTEIAGFKCTVVSKELRAEVITPQIVRVPTFKQDEAFPQRGRPSNLKVTCRGGSKSGQTTVYATRHPSEVQPILSGQTANPSATTKVDANVEPYASNVGIAGTAVATEAGLFLGNAIARGIMNKMAWTYLYFPSQVDVK